MRTGASRPHVTAKRRYDGREIRVLERFNGEKVMTLWALADAASAVLDKGEEEFLRFNFGAESQDVISEVDY